MILDEPTSYLDIRHKLEFLDILKDLTSARGIGVIMSMHELELAHMISDRVICISGTGEIVRTGTPEEVAACEASYTGQFLKPVLERAKTAQQMRKKAATKQ